MQLVRSFFVLFLGACVSLQGCGGDDDDTATTAAAVDCSAGFSCVMQLYEAYGALTEEEKLTPDEDVLPVCPLLADMVACVPDKSCCSQKGGPPGGSQFTLDELMAPYNEGVTAFGLGCEQTCAR